MFRARFPPRLLAVALALLTAIGGLVVVGSGHPAAPSAGSTSHATTPSPTASAPHVSPLVREAGVLTPAAPAFASSSPSASLSPAEIFLPNPILQAAGPYVGPVRPSYSGVPAPMGVSDFGVGTNNTTYAYTTTSFEGTFSVGSFDAFSPGFVQGAPFQAPDWGLLQLNAVAVNVTYAPLAPPGVFWIQNAVHLNRSGFEFEDNIWNLTSSVGGLSPAILSGSGRIYSQEFYAGFGSFTPQVFPFTLKLFDNISRVGTHVVVHFNYTLIPGSGPAQPTVNYDTVVFNGTASSVSPPQFEVNGGQTTPTGLLYDAELVLGGNGAGGHANVVALNASARLLAWNHTSLAYRPVRSAYDFGADSSETAFGVAEHYASGGSTAYLSCGPSALYGLWNTSAGPVAPAASSGSIHLQLTTAPAYAFVFANLSSLGQGYSYAPSNAAGVVSADLPPPIEGLAYRLEAWADGFAPGNLSFTNSTTATLSLNASASTVDAPIYLDGDAQARAFANATVYGTAYGAASRTLWLNTSGVALAPPFRSLNAHENPTFQLFAEKGLATTNVAVHALSQARSTFNYTFYNGSVRYYPGWTQGYFFLGGTASFSASTLQIQGNPGLFNNFPLPTFSPPTVEFFDTTHSSASSISASNDAQGVTAVGAVQLVVTGVQASSGAKGVVASYLGGLTVNGVTATGQDLYLMPSTGAALDHVSATRVHAVTASSVALGLNVSNSTNVSVVGVTVSSGATGFNGSGSSEVNVSWVNVTDNSLSAAGNWSSGTKLNFTDLSILGLGLDLQNDTLVYVKNGTAEGAGTAVVQEFANSTWGTFVAIDAVSGATGLNLSRASNLTVRNVTADLSSLGVLLNASSNVVGDGILSLDRSFGVFWSNGTNGTFNNVTAMDLSVGFWAQNGSRLTVTNVTAWNLTVGATTYVQNQSTQFFYPVAGAAFYNDSQVVVTGVRATGYPFGVWSNMTRTLTVTNVIGWYSGVVVNVNNTSRAHVQLVFSFGSAYGLFLSNCTNGKVTNSTFEASTVLGVYVANGATNSIASNNFVGNNGSSVNGVYSPRHVQAWTSAAVGVSFSSNFWSDHSGFGNYIVNGTVQDGNPRTDLSTTYLEFAETGLVSGEFWILDLGAYPAYNTTMSHFYIPGWSLPATATIPFEVLAPIGIPTHPRFGNVTWTGGTLASPITIVFGTPSQPLLLLGLPAWEFLSLVAAVVVVALVAVLLLFRRRRPPARPAPSTFDPDELP